MESKKTIRIAMVMGKMVGGGVESMVMNYYRHINKLKYQFDFIVDRDSTHVPEEEILSLGGRVIYISPYQEIINYNKDLKAVFKNNNYEIVHSHINAMSVFPLRIAKKNKIPFRIAHNHSTAARGEYKKNFIKKILKIFSTKYANKFVAPTLETGIWLFGEKHKSEIFILKNAIDLDLFVHNYQMRTEIREKLNIEDTTKLIGFFGRLAWAKNPLFSLNILKILVSKYPNFKLIIIGEGELRPKLEKYIEENNLIDKVIFHKNTNTIFNYYQGLDILIFPSKYEGLGMVSIEAQVSGLHVINSDNVPKEVALTNKAKFLDLRTPQIWADEIISILSKKELRVSPIEEAVKKGYDIKNAVDLLEDYYDSFYIN